MMEAQGFGALGFGRGGWKGFGVEVFLGGCLMSFFLPKIIPKGWKLVEEIVFFFLMEFFFVDKMYVNV